MSSISVTAQVLGSLAIELAGTDGQISVNVIGTAPAIVSLALGTPGPQGIPGPAGSQGPAGVMYADYPLLLDTETHTLSIDLADYATQAWVDAQGYLQAGALMGYATEYWVQSQGFLTSSSLDGYATQSWVSSQGYATQSWVTTALTAKVSKTGDTMTGGLLVDYGSTIGETYVQGGVVSLNGSGDFYGYGVNLDGLNGEVVISSPSDGYMRLNPASGLRFADGSTQTTAGISSASAASTYAPLARGIPSGGSTGQALVKTSSTDYATAWSTITASTAWGSITGTLSSQTDLNTALGLKAPLASPALTGSPTAPTATLADSSTLISTTAFVQQELASGTAKAATLVASVRNETGATLAPLTVVYVNGASGNKPTVAKAQANAESTSSGTFAVIAASIANNNNGTAVIAGILSGMDTSAFTAGDQLWLSPTTAGGVTTTKPSAPNHAVFVGIVSRVHATQGTVEVRIQNGYELQELHNVAISSATNLDLLAYESSTSLWKNKSFSTLGLETASHAASTYYPLTGNPSGFLTSSALSGYATESWVTSQSYLTTSAAASTYQPIGSYLTDAPSDGSYYMRKDGAWESVTVY